MCTMLFTTAYALDPCTKALLRSMPAGALACTNDKSLGAALAVVPGMSAGMLDVDPGLQGGTGAAAGGVYHCAARRIQGRRKEPGRGANPRPGRQALRRSARLSPKTGGRGGQLMRGE